MNDSFCDDGVGVYCVKSLVFLLLLFCLIFTISFCFLKKCNLFKTSSSFCLSLTVTLSLCGGQCTRVEESMVTDVLTITHLATAVTKNNKS